MRLGRGKDKLWIQWQGRIYSLPLRKESTQEKKAAERSELAAPFACKVLRVHLKSGQTVKAGDPGVVVEAMKMEYSYVVPRDGIVDSVLVKEGQTLQAGQPFVRWKDKNA